LAELEEQIGRSMVRIAKLEAENAAAKSRIAELERENRELRQLLEDERRKGKRQASPFAKSLKENPKKPGRKPGPEYGNRSRRAIPKKIDRRETVECPMWCSRCGGRVKLDHVEKQYQTDIPPVTPTTTEFTIQVGVCVVCGREARDRHPEQISDATGPVGGVQIGPRAIALAAHLNKSCGMSWERIAAVFRQVFAFEVSRSGLCRSLRRLACRGQPLYDTLREQIRSEPVISPDETGWRVGGASAWLHTAATPQTTVYSIAPGRGFAEAEYLLGEDYAGFIVPDGWAPYRNFIMAVIQTCLAHLLRRSSSLQDVPRSAESREWLEAISATLKEGLALRDRRSGYTEHGYAIACGRLEAAFDRLLDNPALDDDTLKFAAYLVRSRHEIFVFLDEPDLPATNFRAEQAIRPAVVNRKMSGGNRTWAGAADQEVITSLFRTWTQRGRDIIASCIRLLTATTSARALALVR
jgi:transposase